MDNFIQLPKGFTGVGLHCGLKDQGEIKINDVLVFLKSNLVDFDEQQVKKFTRSK